MTVGWRKAPWLLLALWCAGCASFRIFEADSRPVDQEMIIDGKTDDWIGKLYVVEGERVSLGILNDNDYLYICLMAQDNETKSQILTNGLTVWLDPAGGQKKTLGIRYPVGISGDDNGTPGGRGNGQDRPEGDKGQAMGGQKPTGHPGRYQGHGDLRDMTQDIPDDMEIIRAGEKEPEKVKADSFKEAEFKILPSDGMLVYEFKIPLAETSGGEPAVGIKSGMKIGIGFETGKPVTTGRTGGPEEGQGGGMPGGGMGGRGGMGGMGGGMGSGGMGGVPRGGSMISEPDRLMIWTIVKLAPAKPAPASRS